jgi:TM2 domain-containing membrane protein YozV
MQNTFLGMFGVHYYYFGRIGKGLLFILTACLVYFGWLVDIFVIPGGNSKDVVGFPLRQ